MKRLAPLALVAFAACGEKQETTAPEVGTPKEAVAPATTETATPAAKAEPIAPAPPAAASKDVPNPQFLPVTEQIHKLVTDKGETPAEADMQPYTETVNLAEGATFDLVPIKGGEFTLGTPDDEADRNTDEGPQVKVEISPFWMGKLEVTWDLYRAFMENGAARNKDGTLNRDSDLMTSEAPEATGEETLIDIVSQPTPPYEPMHFEMGEGYGAGWPAIAMTQHAASKFCEWLSAQTGHYYRLPTEAEWEYACRAGTSTPWSFGADESAIGDFAWTEENCEYTYQKVGQKTANPWGLHDMHGNVAEWCLDAYLPDAYSKWKPGVKNPWHQATARYPRVARGGFYETGGAETMRSGIRIASDINWKSIDPQNPKSIWYHTSNMWIGFRVVRPLETPDVPTMHTMWNTGPGEAY